MSRNHKNIDELFDRVTAAMRNERPEQTTVDEAAGRVWARVSGEVEHAAPTAAPAEHIRGCADFQSLIPPFLKRELSPARRLLFEDHTQECLPCRRALQAARQVRTAPARPAPQAIKARRPGATLLARPAARWAIAASLVLVCGLVMFPLLRRWTPFGGALEPVVQAVDGAVFVVDETRAEAVSAGQKLRRGERVRTAKEAGAVVRLPDGSLIEMRERSEFSVSENSSGTTLHLERGSVIVQAAKQRTGHLFVATEDCLVSVTGTVFSVNSGTKGARVSVIEGEVHVDHNGAKNVLHAGDQVATRSSLEPVPVRQEIAWSRDAERYAKMLAGIEELRRDLAERVTVPGVRHSTRFLEAMPEATAFYAALPNLSNTVVESYRVLQEQLAKNEALREGWGRADKDGGPSADAKIQEVIEKIRRFGGYLGEEIAVGVGVDAAGRPGAPLVVAELKDAASFKAALEEEVQRAGGNDPSPLKFVADPLTAAEFAGGRALYLWVREDLFAASPQLEQLKALAVNLQSPSANAFRQSAFYARLADVYRDGAGLVVGADLQRILALTLAARTPDAEPRMKAMEQLGVTNLQHFILELKEQQGRGSNRAVVSFTEPRRGMASWLAAPGPMGALEFVSPEANMVAAFVVKEPVALVDDLLGALETVDPKLREHLATFERENNLNVRQDLAAPLGGEFAFAMDGPVLPSPSWKMIFEVNDAARLQQTFERLVERLNAHSPSGRSFQLEPGDSGGQFYTLRSNAFGLEVSYAYVNGYFIMTPSRALLDRALRYRDSGVTLLTSPKFTATLPSDGQANFSALFYHNLAPLVQPVAGQVAQAASGAMGGDKQAMLASLGSMSPALAYAYAQGDQIVFAANTEQGALGLNPASWLGATGSFGLRHVFDDAARKQKTK